MTEVLEPRIFSGYQHVRAGVSTRDGGVSPNALGMNMSYKVGDDPINVSANREIFLGNYSGSEKTTAFAEQCHSSVVRIIDEPGIHSKCDGLITQARGIGLAVSIADCVPVLLYDPITETIAAIHAGWRGSLEKIVSVACEILQVDIGSQLEDVKAYIGPSAGPCCYEVSRDVLEQFRGNVRAVSDGEMRLDLKKENRLQLEEAGVHIESIEMEEKCTICSPDIFHSYRRDKEQSGRMLAYISLKED